MWARNKKVQYLAILSTLAFLLAGVLFFVLRSDNKTAILTAPSSHYTLEVVRSDADKAKGLGGRSSMPKNHGMLFTYDKPGLHCFWMKDMRFPLDIFWLDQNKRIVHVETDVSPDTYPHVYCPKAPARYVIELNAGEYAESGMSLHAKVSF